jgi:excinuclease UvrABC ATPase subunit
MTRRNLVVFTICLFVTPACSNPERDRKVSELQRKLGAVEDEVTKLDQQNTKTEKKVKELEGRLNNLVSNIQRNAVQERKREKAREAERNVCGTCYGNRIVACERCGGRGTIRVGFSYVPQRYDTCPNCAGRGTRPCLDCLGSR